MGRYLVLHGRGTNSDILESQLQPLFSLLPSDNTYEFVDGEYPCEPAAGIDMLYPGPYLAYYKSHDTESVRIAHEFLETVLEEDGPFDGVIGFSQGAALASSYMLTQLQKSPHAELPWKVAIFFSSGIPLSPSPSIGSDFTLEAHTLEKAAQILARDGKRRGSDSGSDDVSEFSTPGTESPASYTEESALDLPKIFCFDPEYTKTHIPIPTVHIMGSNDPWVGYAKSLQQVCRPDIAKVHIHTGVHEVPKNKNSWKICSGLIETAVATAYRM